MPGNLKSVLLGDLTVFSLRKRFNEHDSYIFVGGISMDVSSLPQNTLYPHGLETSRDRISHLIKDPLVYLV